MRCKTLRMLADRCKFEQGAAAVQLTPLELLAACSPH